MMRNISERLSNVSKVAQLVNYTQVSSVQPSISEDTKSPLDLIETAKQCKHLLSPNPIPQQLLFFDEESHLWIWSETEEELKHRWGSWESHNSPKLLEAQIGPQVRSWQKDTVWANQGAWGPYLLLSWARGNLPLTVENVCSWPVGKSCLVFLFLWDM